MPEIRVIKYTLEPKKKQKKKQMSFTALSQTTSKNKGHRRIHFGEKKKEMETLNNEKKSKRP
jgi:hypothetical protein